MRIIAIVIGLSAATVFGDEPKKGADPQSGGGVKCAVDRLPKSRNLVVKSLTVKEVTKDNFGQNIKFPPTPYVEIRLPLEFAKDTTEVKAMRKAFVCTPELSNTRMNRNNIERVQFHFFDEDNVLVMKTEPWQLEGELSGAAGDAFRVILFCPADAYKKVKKIDARLFEPEK